MAIFSLMTTFTAAFAWFMSTRETGEMPADNITVETAGGALQSITFHHLIENGKTMVTENGVSRPSKYEFDKTPIGRIDYNWYSATQTYVPTSQGNTKIELETYTPLDQEHPLLLMINYTDERVVLAGERAISANSIVNHYLGERSSGGPVCNLDGSVYNSGQQDANEMILKQEAVINSETHEQEVNAQGNPIFKNWFPLSSAVKFMYAELCETGKSYSGEMSIDDVTTTNTYEFNLTNSQATTELKDAQQNFVTVDDETEVTSFIKNTSVYSSPAGKHIKHIALVIDYYADAIEFIYSTYLGNRTLENDFNGILNFTCDWTMVI